MKRNSDIQLITQPNGSKRVQWSYTLPDTVRPYGKDVLHRAMKRCGIHFRPTYLEWAGVNGVVKAGFKAELNDGIVCGSYEPRDEDAFAPAQAYIEALTAEAETVDLVVILSNAEMRRYREQTGDGKRFSRIEDAQRQAARTRAEFEASVETAFQKDKNDLEEAAFARENLIARIEAIEARLAPPTLAVAAAPNGKHPKKAKKKSKKAQRQQALAEICQVARIASDTLHDAGYASIADELWYALEEYEEVLG